MLEAYRAHVAERAVLGIPPLPLSAKQTTELVERRKNPPAGEGATLVELITYRVPAGVDDAAKVWLARRGYDPAYGARPLRRLVQQAIGDKLARALLGGEIRDGDTVRVSLAEDGESLSLN